MTGEDSLDDERVGTYLKEHHDFLESHVLEHVDAETLERWLIRRSQRDRNQSLSDNNQSARRISLSRWKFCVHADKRKMLQTLMNSLASQPQPGHILWELACCVSSAVGADGFILHLVHPQSNRLSVFKSCDSDADIEQGTFDLQLEDESNIRTDGIGTFSNTVATYVAESKHTLTIDDIRIPDPRFPDGSLCLQEGGIHILGAPVINNDGTLAAIIELYRREESTASTTEKFHEEDEEIVSSYLVWGGIALHYADMYHALNKQRHLHQFLLTVVKSIFQDIVSMDSLVAKVMSFAQKLVDADRASLFLVDSKSSELYARIFDMGGSLAEIPSEEIRFPIGTGIAGQVALTGQVLNIPDAYSDSRFNRAVDQRIGYRTRSILCMPIFIEGRVFSVVQMVNKRHGAFTKEDEESFELFATYCGLALHQAKLYERIRLSEQIYRVTLEVLSYHNCCSEEEVSTLQKLPHASDHPPVGIDQFWFSSFSLGDLEKVNSAVFMFVDLFGLARFERDALVRFMLTVKKNYRRVPYHNWTHGFNVANCMYVILKRAKDAFEPLEALALFVGCLCHDLDHRGKNNKFMLDSASPLASIYTTSTMEHHHFNQTVTILQQDSQNIFSKLPSDEYKQVLKNIKHCILATDLAKFFPNRLKLAQLVETNSFSWQEKEHRSLVQAIAMTGSDLSISAKPWEIQTETVKVTFEEFYQQGDEEREAGRIPISMMDRTKPHLLPESQVGFITGICAPCYGLLNQLIPETKPLLDGCLKNLQRWKGLAEENASASVADDP